MSAGAALTMLIALRFSPVGRPWRNLLIAIVRSTLMPLLTPDHMRGRVSAVNGMFIASSAEIGDFESGIMASLFGTMPAVLIGGCITLAVVGFTFLGTRKMTSLSLAQLTEPPAHAAHAAPAPHLTSSE